MLVEPEAIALAAPLHPKYRVAIEKRIYLCDSEDSLLVGIPDVAVTTQAPTPTSYSTATLPIQGESVTVTLPIPEEIREGYLEIRSEPGDTIVSYDDNEEPVSIEFLNASKRQLFNPQELQLTIAT